MTDRLRQASDRVHLARMQLQRRGAEDLADAYSPPGQSHEPRVSGTTGTNIDPNNPDAGTVTLTQTERAIFAQAHDHQLATRLLEQAASLLERGLERMSPPKVGGQCPTIARDTTGELIRCTGEIATHEGVCTKCAGDWRIRRGLEVPAYVIAQRNRRRTVKCGCHRDGCDHPPGVCVRDLEPGQVEGRCRTCRESADTSCKCDVACGLPASPGRTVNDACRKRMERAKPNGGAFSWHAPR